MLVVFSLIFVAETKKIPNYNFVAPVKKPILSILNLG